MLLHNTTEANAFSRTYVANILKFSHNFSYTRRGDFSRVTLLPERHHREAETSNGKGAQPPAIIAVATVYAVGETT